MGFPRRYTKQSIYKELPIATDREQNKACDTVALNSIKTMMDKGLSSTDETIKIVRLDVTLPVSLKGNEIFNKAQADVVKYFRRHDVNLQYVAYKHETSDGNIYRMAILAPNDQPVEDIAEKIEKVFNQKIKANDDETNVSVATGAVVPFSESNQQSYAVAFKEASAISQVKLADSKTKVLFSSKGN